MDKVKNISLGGFSFIIEETAYNALNNYLTEVRNHLNQNTDREEILYDVEQRMAELLKDRMAQREVVIGQDVQYLIEVLGRPEQYVEGEENPPTETKFTFSSLKGRKLYRDIDDKKIGGVLSGIAHYLQYDVTWVRVFFLLAFLVNVFILHFFTSTLLLLYIIFWAVVPPARTAAEKLEMKGEAVTIDTLSNFSFTGKEPLKPQGNGFPILLKVILYFIAILLLLPLLITLVAIVLSLFGVTISGGIVLLAGNDFLPFIVTATWQRSLLYLSAALLLLFPVSVVLLLCFKLFVKGFRTPKSWIVFNVLSLAVGIIGTFIVLGTVLRDFTSEAVMQEKIPVLTTSDTLVLHKEYPRQINLMSLKNDSLIVADCNFNINELLEDTQPYIEVSTHSRGRTVEQAERYTKNVHYILQVKDNQITIPKTYQISKGDIYRGQRLQITLFVPKSKVVKTD
ncbi:hypothetical protein RCZ04_21480 [Capnocytophaga sp. HP1101]